MRSIGAPLRMMTRVLCTFACFAIAGSAWASPQPRVTISASPAIRAGEDVAIRIEGLPAAADEFEVLLVSDSFPDPVRITPELPASTRTIQWHVPSLPAGNATVVVRMSIGGNEISSAVSRPFAIEASGSHAPRFTFRDGEWWAVANDSHGEEGAAPSDRVSSAPAQSLAAIPSSRDQIAAPRASNVTSETIQALRDKTTVAPVLASTPLTIPLRH